MAIREYGATVTPDSEDPHKADIEQQPDPLDLYADDTITWSLSGFPSGAQITKISFYHAASKPQPPIYEWPTDPGGGHHYQVTQGDGSLTAKDTEPNPPGGSQEHWYEITVRAGTDYWQGDPKLINKKKKKK